MTRSSVTGPFGRVDPSTELGSAPLCITPPTDARQGMLPESNRACHDRVPACSGPAAWRCVDAAYPGVRGRGEHRGAFGSCSPDRAEPTQQTGSPASMPVRRPIRIALAPLRVRPSRLCRMRCACRRSADDARASAAVSKERQQGPVSCEVGRGGSCERHLEVSAVRRMQGLDPDPRIVHEHVDVPSTRLPTSSAAARRWRGHENRERSPLPRPGCPPRSIDRLRAPPLPSQQLRQASNTVRPSRHRAQRLWERQTEPARWRRCHHE